MNAGRKAIRENREKGEVTLFPNASEYVARVLFVDLWSRRGLSFHRSCFVLLRVDREPFCPSFCARFYAS